MFDETVQFDVDTNENTCSTIRFETIQFNVGTNDIPYFWGISSVGRASALQAECRQFDSDIFHSQ